MKDIDPLLDAVNAREANRMVNRAIPLSDTERRARTRAKVAAIMEAGITPVGTPHVAGVCITAGCTCGKNAEHKAAMKDLARTIEKQTPVAAPPDLATAITQRNAAKQE